MSERSSSLDVFRGLTIAGMMLVNSPGNGTAYPWLEHAEWHGLTPADLVFPFFLFIVGVSIVFSFQKRMKVGLRPSELLRSAAQRALILFALGIFLNGFWKYDFSTIRIPGVLQRIALAYLGGAFCCLFLNVRARWAALIAILLGYWGLLHGDLSPEGNLAARIDRFLLPGHLYRPHYDPEGLLSTLPAIGTVLIGNLAARRPQNWPILCGGMIVLGYAWSFLFPLNKALWTSSYVLLTAGLAWALLELIYWLVDQKGIRKPFVWAEALGLNAIAAYVIPLVFLKIQNRLPVQLPDGSEGNVRLWLTGKLFSPWLSDVNASLAYAIVYTVLWTSIFWVLYRKKVFIKI